MEQNGQRIISADSHVHEPPDLWWNAMADKFGDRTPRLVDEHLGKKGKFFVTGAQVTTYFSAERDAAVEKKIPARLRDAGHNPKARLGYQKEESVDAEVMNTTCMLVIMRAADREMVRASAEVYNDWLADFCSYSPKTLIGTSVIPIDDVDWALRELDRVTQRGLNGAMINLDAPEGALPYRDPVYDPFWAAAEEMGAPVTLHVVSGRHPSPFHFYTPEEKGDGPRALIVYMAEIMGVLVNEFIMGGILDRFPKLKVLDSEFELSWIPWFMNRIDQSLGQLAFRLSLPMPELQPSEYMRSRIWHGFIDDPYVSEAVPHIGASQILWGSDFPHEESIGLGAHETISKMLAGFSEEDREKIVRGNAAKVWGL